MILIRNRLRGHLGGENQVKIIIVGCGKVGLTLAEQLTAEKHDVVVIDMNYKKLRAVTDTIDVMCIEGNGISSETLIEAGVKNSDLVIATMDSDEKNVMCALIAKTTGNCQTIARVRNPEYIKEIRLIKDELNMAMVINPDNAAASEIARLVRYPSSVIKCETFAKGRVDMLTIAVPKESVLDGLKISDFNKTLKSNILICSVERGEEVFIPSGDFILREGDVISFVGKKSHQMLLFKELKMATDVPKSVMIVGGSNIAYYLAKFLEESRVSIKIIDTDMDKCSMLSSLLDSTTIINGDATDKNVLLEEGIQDVDAVVALTGLDEENIIISLYAKSVSEAKVITKINRINFENVVASLDIGSVINPKLISADSITRYVRGMQNSLGSNIETLYRIASGKAEALEFRVKKEFRGVKVPLMDMKLKPNLLLACIHRKGNLIIPGGHDYLEVDDTVIVVTTVTGLDDLNDCLA